MSFEDNCVKETDIPNDLKKLKDEYKLFRDYLVELYSKINYSVKSSIKSPINTVVGGLLKEAIELLDGIYILSSNYSVKNVVLLLRKLFEICHLNPSMFTSLNSRMRTDVCAMPLVNSIPAHRAPEYKSVI